MCFYCNVVKERGTGPFSYQLTKTTLQEIEFIRHGILSAEELDAFGSILEIAGKKFGQRRTPYSRPREETKKVSSVDKSIADLESMGVRIYGLNESHAGISNGEISWDYITGYDNQKRYVPW